MYTEFKSVPTKAETVSFQRKADEVVLGSTETDELRRKRSSATIPTLPPITCRPHKSVCLSRLQFVVSHHIDIALVFTHALPPMINPGSGLKILDDTLIKTENLFGTISSSITASKPPVQTTAAHVTPACPGPPVVRRYGSAVDL